MIRPADAAAIEEAGAILAAGGIVGMPTETVYGLAADATNPNAVARIYAAKGRPSFNPLIAHVPGRAEAEREAAFTETARALADRFWPGPLTLVLARRAHGRVCDLACAGLATIALRAPDHPTAQALIRAHGGPIAAPSANRSGRLSPTTAADVEAELGDAVALILDGGPSVLGLESTVVACLPEGAAILRPGVITQEMLTPFAGPLLAPGAGIASPGQLESHYAPNAAVRLNATAPHPGEAMLGFGPVAGDLTLSAAGDLTEAAANLYRHLRTLDARAARIAVAPIPAIGLGAAINDRLSRAAAARS